MANSNFVVKNGLEVGGLTIFAPTVVLQHQVLSVQQVALMALMQLLSQTVQQTYKHMKTATLEFQQVVKVT